MLSLMFPPFLAYR